ncbi:class I SAM-dependent methyltransferase [Malaciobacter mytili]|uniref:Methyltransferase type 11 n=1 Tax=Malaciobacter mytili LMG 24559 TaxID=1032238 RepID=A0AAX2ALU7_9BACT|nr:class I SAM-dependent methyltransferase [Malaciobacter mytili]AXH16136.1 methyltransferase [Malaciobacter mytili LMG 24559]RXI40506.1 methyltransferase type 11 [Malaciobacter mytili]RXK17036.1 methyltransferase type 11 [Malaciobacter mytili LMG 24559]
MGIEIDLLKNYPKTKRDLKQRADEKTPEDRAIARQFGKEFFDGERKHGYGGFSYMSRFWQPVIPTFIEHFNLDENSKVLDVGCAKGFMLFDLKQALPNISIEGIDISSYAIENAKEEVKSFLKVGNAKELPYEDNSFDVVISINTIHNLEKEECAKALKEIQRVSKGKSFITVDAYRNEEEKEAMFAWNLTAKTIMSVEEWKAFFKEVGYTGDYYWFIP